MYILCRPDMTDSTGYTTATAPFAIRVAGLDAYVVFRTQRTALYFKRRLALDRGYMPTHAGDIPPGRFGEISLVFALSDDSDVDQLLDGSMPQEELRSRTAPASTVIGAM